MFGVAFIIFGQAEVAAQASETSLRYGSDSAVLTLPYQVLNRYPPSFLLSLFVIIGQALI